MWFRVAPKTWSRNGNAGNKAEMQRRVAADDIPGLLAYHDGNPVGWVSIAPRPQYARIAGPAEKAAGDDDVWSIVCFFIATGQRGAGIGRALLGAAVDYARRHGASAIEGYPIEREGASNAEAFTGVRSMFEKAGFREAGRFDRWLAVPHVSGDAPRALVRPPGRPVMRLEL